MMEAEIGAMLRTAGNPQELGERGGPDPPPESLEGANPVGKQRKLEKAGWDPHLAPSEMPWSPASGTV